MNVDIHALSGAYAVDAVDEFERAQFERHISDCPSCRAEVDSLRLAASLLGEVSARPAPEALRAAILTSVRTVRPLPPALVSTTERLSTHRRRSIPALVAASVALIALGGAGATVWHPWDPDNTTQAPSASQRIEDAPDTQVFQDPVETGGTVTVSRSKSLNLATVAADGLDPLPAGQTYQLWLIHDRRFVPAGSMSADASAVLLEGDARTATRFGITIEDDVDVQTPDYDAVVAMMELKA